MDGRTQNAERSRAALLDAALTEFAERGLAGARVADIARRAGVNKQLISYYFGGKDGLYRAILTGWQERESALRAQAESLEDLVVLYLEAALADRRWAKLSARALLDDQPQPVADTGESNAELADLRERQRAGQLAPDLDPAAVLLAFTAMVSAPAMYGGAPPGYADQLRLIARKLAH